MRYFRKVYNYTAIVTIFSNIMIMMGNDFCSKPHAHYLESVREKIQLSNYSLIIVLWFHLKGVSSFFFNEQDDTGEDDIK